MALESSLYFVMKHYGLSLREIDQLSTEEFSMMFTWAAAAAAHEAELTEKQTAASKSSMPVAGTKVGGPMPFSEGKW